jgi:hypothetical protein
MKKNLLIVAVLVIIGFVLYAPNLHNKLFWDDEDWIVNNPAVHSLSWQNIKFIFSHDTLAGIGLTSNYYRPFLFLTFLANYIFVGIQPIFYHLTNNAIHIANAVLIFYVLEETIKKRRVSIVAALLFLIHPLQTEAVAYIAGRGDPLSVLFMLAALLCFFREWKILPYIFAVLAVLSRETAFLFPVYLTIFLMAFRHREKFLVSLKKSIWDSRLFYGISLIYGILRLTVLNFQNTLNFYHQSNVYTEHLTYRLFTFMHVLAVYFKLIFVPTGLHMERDVAVNTSFFQWPVWLGGLIVLTVIYLLYHFYKKEKFEIKVKNNNISNFRLWLFGWGIFFVGLAPTSGIFPINALIYEHWLYFSLFGFVTIVAYYGDSLFQWLINHTRPLGYALGLIFVLFCMFLGAQTVRRNIIWGDLEGFYKEVLFYEPQNVRVLNNLANYYSDRGRLSDAEKLLWEAVDIGDIQPAPYYNLGNLLRDRGDYAGAIELYKKSILIDKNFPFSYTNLAAIYSQQGNLAQALEYLEQLKSIEPNNYSAYYNIGLIYHALGRKKDALESLNTGLALVKGNIGLENKFKETINSFK